MIDYCIRYIGDSGKVKVEIEWIGEGWDGDYDPDNPDDVPFLRFSVYKREDDGHWESIDDSSYCTLLPATVDEDIVMDAIKYIMGSVETYVCGGHPIKKVCEQLSWIKPEWFRKSDEEDIS
jgi:hypothetical protein